MSTQKLHRARISRDTPDRLLVFSATHVGPPLDEEDGAARVTDPIFVYANEGLQYHGTFFKDYRQSPW